VVNANDELSITTLLIHLIKSCQDPLACKSTIWSVQYYDITTADGGWIVAKVKDNSISFFRRIGDLGTDFWYGLKFLTQSG